MSASSRYGSESKLHTYRQAADKLVDDIISAGSRQRLIDELTTNAGDALPPPRCGSGQPAFFQAARPSSAQDQNDSFATFSAMFRLSALETRTSTRGSLLKTGITSNSRSSFCCADPSGNFCASSRQAVTVCCPPIIYQWISGCFHHRTGLPSGRGRVSVSLYMESRTAWTPVSESRGARLRGSA